MPKVKRREFNNHFAYKRGNIPVAKVKIVGKTLNVYLGLNPEDYKNTKYKFIDVSSIKAHKSYPMRVKITSERQARWVKELIEQLVNVKELYGELN
jgi:predicted transport protein